METVVSRQLACPIDQMLTISIDSTDPQLPSEPLQDECQRPVFWVFIHELREPCSSSREAVNQEIRHNNVAN